MIGSALKIKQILALRGKRSRNKVSVGEPAEGSFIILNVLLELMFKKEGNFFFMYAYFLGFYSLFNYTKYLKFSTMDI